MKTYFNQRSTWMRLIDEKEVNLLKELLISHEYGGQIISKEMEHSDRFGDRIIVVVSWPDSCNSRILMGDTYTKWERIKSTIYNRRRRGA